MDLGSDCAHKHLGDPRLCQSFEGLGPKGGRCEVCAQSRLGCHAGCRHQKGRSSSRALDRELKRAAALQVAGGLYPAIQFGPTRLNVADDPTREADLRNPHPHSILDRFSRSDLYAASSFRCLTRPLANWLRLARLLIGFRSSYPVSGFLRSLPSGS